MKTAIVNFTWAFGSVAVLCALIAIGLHDSQKRREYRACNSDPALVQFFGTPYSPIKHIR